MSVLDRDLEIPHARLRWPALGGPRPILDAGTAQSLVPAQGEVVLVACNLDWPPEGLTALRRLLSAKEQERAAKFAHAHLRDRWTAGRGLLRVLLGAAAGLEPVAIKFKYAEHGKPSLAAGPDVRFNVSHSHAVGLYAFSSGREVGVDVEAIRKRNSDGVANRFFHANESAALAKLPDAQRVEAFFGVWCCKEAFIKATGAGLSQSLSSFEFELGPRGPVRLSWFRDDPQAPGRWTVHLLDPADGVRAALIAEGEVSRLRCVSLAPSPE